MSWDGHTIDLDIQNCCLTLLQQIIYKTAPQPPMPDDLVQLMDRFVKDRAGVLKELSLHTVEGKEMINTVLNGGRPPTSLRNNEIVQGLQKNSLYVRWMACNLLHADYMSLADNKQKTFPSSTILSLLWTSVEDRILQSWTDHVLTRTTKPKHLSLHFDGIRISADHVGVQQEEFIRDCENAINKRTGFVVKIVPKKHQNFIQLAEDEKYTRKCAHQRAGHSPHAGKLHTLCSVARCATFQTGGGGGYVQYIVRQECGRQDCWIP